MPISTPPTESVTASLSEAGYKYLTAATAVLVLYPTIFPRAAAAIFLIPVMLAFGLLWARKDRSKLSLRVGPLLWSAVAFAVFAIVSAAWSAAPLASLSKPLFLLGGSIGIGVLAMLAREYDAEVLRHLSLGALLGLVIGGGILCFETVTDQAMTRFFYNLLPWLQAGQEKHLTVDNGVVLNVGETNINRRATMVTLLLVPAALATSLWSHPLIRWGGRASILIVIAILMLYSAHQSSQAAIVAGVAAFLMALASSRWTAILVGAAWCLSCLLVVPIVTTLHATDLHKNEKGLFKSARHRIVIWNYTAELVHNNPLLGVGADATATITLAKEHSLGNHREKLEWDGQFEVSAARHAHNAFLQVWYELGAVGAALFTALGAFALAAMRSARSQLQPYLIAEFAAIAGMIAFSFSLWQLWFQGAIGLGIVALLIGAAASRDKSID